MGIYGDKLTFNISSGRIDWASSGRVLPQGLSPIYFPVGNEATSFMVIFAFIAVVVGAASCLSGLHHLQIWGAQSLASSAASSMTAWALTLLAMGLWKSSSSRVFSNLFSSGEWSNGFHGYFCFDSCSCKSYFMSFRTSSSLDLGCLELGFLCCFLHNSLGTHSIGHGVVEELFL